MHGIMRDSFRVADIPAAYLSFNEMLTVTQALLNEKVEVRCPPCKTVGRDEVLLISAVAELQHGDRAAFDGIMSNWIPAEAVHHVLPAYTDFAMTLLEKEFKPRRWYGSMGMVVGTYIGTEAG
jgi:hypothetical protein